jgi:hypothetical protein
VFYYLLPEEPAADTEITLSVFAGQEAEPVWSWTRKPAPADEEEPERGENDPPDTRILTAKKGLNRYSWDLHYPGMQRFDKLILWNDMKSGPVAVPGSYRVRLTVGEVSQELPFDVRPDPRSTSTHEDYVAQFAFVIECRDLLSRTHREIARIRQLRTRLEDLKMRFEAMEQNPTIAAVLEEIASISLVTDSVEEALYQTNNESEQDPLNFPIRLNDKLSGVMRQVAAGDKPPTRQAVEVKAELSAAIGKELSILDGVWSEQLPHLNATIRSTGIEFVVAPEREL